LGEQGPMRKDPLQALDSCDRSAQRAERKEPRSFKAERHAAEQIPGKEDTMIIAPPLTKEFPTSATATNRIRPKSKQRIKYFQRPNHLYWRGSAKTSSANLYCPKHSRLVLARFARPHLPFVSIVFRWSPACDVE
jgi:hypothetical protein